MSGNLLDTCVIINILRGDSEAINFLESLGNDIFVPVIAIGELLYGAKKSTKIEQNTRMVKDLMGDFAIIPIDAEIAEIYGEIKTDLVKSGNKLPENDIWIAATAKKYGLVLATFDNHFHHVDGLDTIGIA